jgi:hypothetical protein
MPPDAETPMTAYAPPYEDDSADQSWDVLFWLNLWRDNAANGDRPTE